MKRLTQIQRKRFVSLYKGNILTSLNVVDEHREHYITFCVNYLESSTGLPTNWCEAIAYKYGQETFFYDVHVFQQQYNCIVIKIKIE